ncbi:hypothetical protein ACFL5S_02175 [Fibrobacterota bacterium]
MNTEKPLLNEKSYWIVLGLYNMLCFFMAFNTVCMYYINEGLAIEFLVVVFVSNLVILFLSIRKLITVIKQKMGDVLRACILPYGLLLCCSVYWLMASMWVIDWYYSDGWIFEWILVVAGKRDWQALFQDLQIP